MNRKIIPLLLVICLICIGALPVFASNISYSANQMSFNNPIPKANSSGTSGEKLGKAFTVSESNSVVKVRIERIPNTIPTVNISLTDETTGEELVWWPAMTKGEEESYDLSSELIKGHKLYFKCSTTDGTPGTGTFSIWTE